MIALSDYLILSSIVFCIGLAGIFINRTNIIMILMCVELILAAVNTNFIAFSFYGSDLAGQIFVFFILCIIYTNLGTSKKKSNFSSENSFWRNSTLPTRQ